MAIPAQLQVDLSDDRRLFDVEVHDGICVVRFVEPVLRDADRLSHLKKTFSRLASDNHHFVFNLTVVEYFSSVALGALVFMHRIVDKVDGRIHLCGVSEAIEELFTICSLNEMFDWFATEEEAVADFRD